jgi:hypothetical protein
MSFKKNERKQNEDTERIKKLTERERRMLEKSWAKAFAEKIFPLIDETAFEKLYSENNGRPNTPINITVGALILKEMNQLTDEELMDAIIFDIRYQYALHLTGYKEIPFSDRTVSRLRERLYWHESETGEDILKEEIERISGELRKIMKIQGKIKRMDSAMISSSCKNMGRLELIYTCVSNLVKALEKTGEIEELPEHIRIYAEEGNRNRICYRIGPGEAKTRLEKVTTDALELYEKASGMNGGNDEFQILERVLEDQTKDGQLKPNKKISPKSLQNPSDEDATYRRKAEKGYQGYVANIIEECGEKENIITGYDYDVNVHSDAAFGAEVIEKIGSHEENVVIISDGAYASDKNFKQAEENNIELVATSMTGQAPNSIAADFVIENNEILTCPMGNEAIDSKYNPETSQYQAHFAKTDCDNCPRRDECPVVMQKRAAIVKLTETTINRARYDIKLTTTEYKEFARKRNGIEGIPSILRRRYRVDEMPVRGLLRSKMWFGFKIGAINVKRFIKYINNFLNIDCLVIFLHKNHSFLLFRRLCQFCCLS